MLSHIYKKNRLIWLFLSLNQVITFTLKLNFTTFIAKILLALDLVTVEKIPQVLSFSPQ